MPYWDFKTPDIRNAPRDASAAAVTASALLEHSTYIKNGKGQYYKNTAIKILKSLHENYQSGSSNPSFLSHSTDHWPNGSEIDTSIIFADYYYLAALLRFKKLNEGKPNI